MMPSRSTPNLQQNLRDSKSHTLYSYLHTQSGYNLNTTQTSRDNESPPPAPPVRDSSSLKSVKYGPGHEKFPSWPVPAAAETPQALRTPPSGGSHRSKSWTDHTNYPKEKVVSYTRPYMKRQHTPHTQQKLKTVMERCEKIAPETYESRYDKINDRYYMPQMNHDGKTIDDREYIVPSPPERDTTSSTTITTTTTTTQKPQLTQADLEEYARSYQEPTTIDMYDQNGKGITLPHLTSSNGLKEFIEYARNYEDTLYPNMDEKHSEEEVILTHLHQKQLSYAQSEGYHSYVSSTDSTSTPFLDRLRRDSDAVVSSSRSQSTWDDLSEQETNSVRREGRDSVVTTSSGSASSSETLKWHGSMSDVSVASSSCTHLASSSNSSISRQLIAHSARVKTPQRHHSESVLYMAANENQDNWKDREQRNNNVNKLKLFPVSTYTMQTEMTNTNISNNRQSQQASLSVADRINELEKQQKYSYLDPEKKHKIPDPTLKAIQKKALLSFYERHQANSGKNNTWRSEPQLVQSKPTLTAAPQPPPRINIQLPSRRASCASDYASHNTSKRSSFSARETKQQESNKLMPKHQHSNSCGSLSTDLLGPVIVGPSISLDDWIPEKPPERPPKNPHLRIAYPDLFQNQRVPSPDLPPPSPPTVLVDEYYNNDEPLPPPPTDLDTQNWNGDFKHKENGLQIASPQVESSYKNKMDTPLKDGLPDRNNINFRASVRRRDVQEKIKSIQRDNTLSFPNHKSYPDRTNSKYPTQKFFNGTLALSEKTNMSDKYRAEPLRSHIIQKEDRKLTTTQSTTPIDVRNNHHQHHHQRASIAEGTTREVPPPLQPRQMRINQSMRARISDIRTSAARISPPRNDKYKESLGNNHETSQSKASYLATRRERDRLIPDPDSGVYKRTMSPNGHPPVIHNNVPHNQESSQRLHARSEQIWPLNKDSNFVNSNNTTNSILRRASLNEKSNNNNKSEKLDNKDEIRKSQMVLPDVLPINAKILVPRSPTYIQRPTQITLTPLDTNAINDRSPKIQLKNSPPPTSTSPKHSSRTSPFSTLRNTSLSSPTISISPAESKSPLSSLENKIAANRNNSPKRISSSIKSQQSSPISSSNENTIRTISSSPLTSSTTSESPLSSLSSTPSSPKETEHPKVIEGLQMIQRTEVVLRVNPCTIDASSQTEKEELPPTPLPTRKKLQEEIECERLSQDFINHLPTSDRLKDLLVPGPEHKKPTDYVSGLFKIDVTSKSRPSNSPFRNRNNTPSPNVTPNEENVNTPNKNSDGNLSPKSPLSATSTYFTTSEPKAKFLTRYSQDMNQYTCVVKNTKDLSQKKDELVNRLDRKLEVLRSEALVVSEECRINNELGENVETHICRVARPHEAAKFRLHIEEVGKITSLLLGLSGRLARAENALMGMPDDHPEKSILEGKRDKLLEQLEEAKKLKESIDKRSISVSNILCKYLNSEEYADYDHFINMKAKLIMDSKEIAEKIKLGEEQLIALKETLIVTD